jgi:hypothetical protein
MADGEEFATRRWLADREAELLPVPYFHVVYTLPSRLRDIAYQSKRVVYDLLMKALSERPDALLAANRSPQRQGCYCLSRRRHSFNTRWGPGFEPRLTESESVAGR